MTSVESDMLLVRHNFSNLRIWYLCVKSLNFTICVHDHVGWYIRLAKIYQREKHEYLRNMVGYQIPGWDQCSTIATGLFK